MSDSGPRAAGHRTAAAVACLGLVAAAAGEYAPARQFVTQDFHDATRTASRRAGLVPEAGLPAPVRVRSRSLTPTPPEPSCWRNGLSRRASV